MKVLRDPVTSQQPQLIGLSMMVNVTRFTNLIRLTLKSLKLQESAAVKRLSFSPEA